MKRLPSIILLNLLCLSLLGFAAGNKQEKFYTLHIEQDGDTILLNRAQILLEPMKFDLVFEFNQPMGVLVSASLSEITYEQAAEDVLINKLPGYHQNPLREELLNNDRDLKLSYDSPSFWYFEDEESNSFNRIDKNRKSIVCKRTVSTLTDTNTGVKTRLNQAILPVYLVVISFDQEKRVELQRQYVKIDWK